MNILEINSIYKSVESLHNKQCPFCGESYYQENYTTTTAAYYPLFIRME